MTSLITFTLLSGHKVTTRADTISSVCEAEERDPARKRVTRYTQVYTAYDMAPWSVRESHSEIVEAWAEGLEEDEGEDPTPEEPDPQLSLPLSAP